MPVEGSTVGPPINGPDYQPDPHSRIEANSTVVTAVGQMPKTSKKNYFCVFLSFFNCEVHRAAVAGDSAI